MRLFDSVQGGLRWQAAALIAALLAIPGAAVADEPVPTYDLRVEFDISRAKIIGRAVIAAPQGAELSIHPGELRVLSLKMAGREMALDVAGQDPVVLKANGPVEIRYEGTFKGTDVDVIDGDKILLRNIWYPVVEGVHRYRLVATVPRDFVVFSEADHVLRSASNGQATYTFDLPYPQRDWDGITLVAFRRWVTRTTKYKDVDLSIHVLPQNADRLDGMIRQSIDYLGKLEARLGAYPFRRLDIVENPVPLKYSLSMSTYVLLSQKSVASTVREDSALNHEITHQWIGNTVLGDYDGGNWVEGLTSYLSDHLEGEDLGIIWERRQRMMAAYQGRVEGKAASPLSEFTESSDLPSRVIGYAKSAIVFHMLRRMLGDDRFFAALGEFVGANRFMSVSWGDMRATFERALGADLGWFFDYWVDGTAMPEIALGEAAVIPVGRQHELRFTITQKPPFLPLVVPVTFYFDDGSATVSVPLSGERTVSRQLLDRRPLRIAVDENYDIFRRLTPEEFPPTLNTLLSRPRVTIVGTRAEQEKFGALIGALQRDGMPDSVHLRGYGRATMRRPAGASPQRAGETGKQLAERGWRTVPDAAAADMTGASLVLLGANNPLITRLFGRVELPRGGAVLKVLKHPHSPGEVVVILAAETRAEVDAVAGELVDRPRYSAAAFKNGKLIFHEMKNGQRGIVRSLVVTSGP
jgi:hypothetical protein